MTKDHRIATSTATRQSLSRAAKVKKLEPPRRSTFIKTEPGSPEPPSAIPLKRSLTPTASPPLKKRRINPSSPPPTNLSATLQARKLKLYTQHNHQSPFPSFPHPTPEECKLAHRILASIHGVRRRPVGPPVPSSSVAGCGASPTVIDALIRTILSQNTSGSNSSRAYRGIVATYGDPKEDEQKVWKEVAKRGPAALEEAIKTGGLAKTKSRVIVSLLEQVLERHGVYSLNHLHETADEDAVMEELLSFKGVGPKTASCVLLFCLGRESFAVDTHVWRISGILGWRPTGATREETHLHLDVKIPGEDKYGLHVLMVAHGKMCEECKAGGKRLGKCELRRAFKGLSDETLRGGMKVEE
jgi:endonuclease III